MSRSAGRDPEGCKYSSALSDIWPVVLSHYHLHPICVFSQILVSVFAQVNKVSIITEN